MATQDSADAVNNLPKDVEELSQLLSDLPAETSSATPTDSGTSPHPASGHSDDSQAPASAAPATAASRHTPTPDEATVARLRGLPKVDKGLRLFQAAVEGALEELEALLAAGADIETTSGGKTALHVAANLGHVEVVRRLLAQGAQVDARDPNQWTPLHWAAHSGHAAVARLLLAASADHRARESSYGWTPLHWAACNGRTEVAAALLEAGASTLAWSTIGETPLDLAVQNKHQEVEDLLSRTHQPLINTIIICSK